MVLREHVKRLDRAKGVAALAEDRQVAGQPRWLAGDVDDLLRLRRDQRVQDRALAIRPPGMLDILNECGTPRTYVGGDQDGGRCTFARAQADTAGGWRRSRPPASP